MKILMVNKFLYPKGGAETYFLKIGKELEKRGHEIQYFGMYDKKNTVGNEYDLYTTNMDFHTKSLKKIFYPLKIIYSFEAKRKIKKIIKKFNPDIIHLNNINFQLTPSIIDGAYKLKVPIIQTVHDSQMICPNHLLLSHGKRCEKCIHGNKMNCTKYRCIHNSFFKSFIGSLEAILYTKILKTYRKVSLYICPSRFIENKLHDSNEIYKNRTRYLPNFIELNNNNVKEKENYILFFGRLSEEKGIKEFIEVCKELKNIEFRVAGIGPLENICKKISNVKYEGFLTGEKLNDLIAKAKFVVYPSICYENAPLSILESESLGTPVLTVNYGGAKELVEPGLTGELISNVTKEELKNEILKMNSDEEKLNNMSKNCLRKKFFTLSEYCNNLELIYKKHKRSSL